MPLTGFHSLWDKIISQTYRPSPDKDVDQTNPPLIRGPLSGRNPVQLNFDKWERKYSVKLPLTR
jgi:hypothetical protein